jgi:hypothetical protein
MSLPLASTLEIPLNGGPEMPRGMACFLGVVVLLVAPGCGGPAKPTLYPVSGKVTLEGKSLANVGIYFISTTDKAQNYSGTIAADGSYSLSDPQDQRQGAEAGKYKVVLQLTGDALKNSMMEAMKQGQGVPAAASLPFPNEYTSAETSPKEVEVKAESNTINITIP